MAETTDRLTHIDETGAARMVDVADKDVTHRRAVAEGEVSMRPETLALIESGEAKKGDVLAAARIAGIMAAKKTSDVIPLCHPLSLTHVSVELTPVGSMGEPGAVEPPSAVRVRAVAETDGKTGVEMEALTAVAVAALTIYDMCKAVDRGMVISDIRLLSKEGGASGTWTRKEDLDVP